MESDEVRRPYMTNDERWQGRSQGSKGRGCEVTICRQPTGLC